MSPTLSGSTLSDRPHATSTRSGGRVLNHEKRRRLFPKRRIHQQISSLWSGDPPFLPLAEREQVTVDEVGMRGGQTMRKARIIDFHRAFNQLC